VTQLALRNASIVCLSSIDWDFVWQAHQEIMSRLAAAENKVVFVENTGGVRSVRATDAGRLVRRAVNAVRQLVRGERRPVANVVLVAPLLVPFARNPVARLLNDRVLTPFMAAKIRRMTGPNPIVYTYLPTANALRLIQLLGGSRVTVVYHSVADYQALAEDHAAMATTEGALVARADLVLVQSAGLRRRFEALSPRVFDLGIGVNLSVFDPAKMADPPAELVDLPRPLIGYVGGLHQHLDVDLLRELAHAFRRGSIVLVGPLLVDSAALPSEPNIHLLGSRAHSELPALVAAFDVGLVPYLRTEYTATVNPTKLFEYLAMGVPVVSVDLPEVMSLDLPPFAVRTAANRQDFIAAVRAVLSEEAAGNRTRRRELALDRDWSRLVERVASLIAQQREKPPAAS
jgi:glycosyltransferase involved in cell wall biosynthesis